LLTERDPDSGVVSPLRDWYVDSLNPFTIGASSVDPGIRTGWRKAGAAHRDRADQRCACILLARPYQKGSFLIRRQIAKKIPRLPQIPT
jgi:hypothetical protein